MVWLSRVGFGILVLALVGLVYVLTFRPDISMKAVFAECSPYYASAHTAEDTSRVDLMYPQSQTKAPNAFTCGALRKRLHAAR